MIGHSKLIGILSASVYFVNGQYGLRDDVTECVIWSVAFVTR